jgi:hypothetical protein
MANVADDQQGKSSLWFWLLHVIAFFPAVFGPVVVVQGVFSFFDGAVNVHGQEIHTTTQKAIYTAAGAASSVVGIGFWWLSWRGYRRSAAIYFLVGLGTLFVMSAVVKALFPGPVW